MTIFGAATIGVAPTVAREGLHPARSLTFYCSAMALLGSPKTVPACVSLERWLWLFLWFV